MSRITPRNREVAAEYWPGVHTMSEVAAQFGITQQAVHKHVSKVHSLGTPSPRPARPRRAAISGRISLRPLRSWSERAPTDPAGGRVAGRGLG